LVALRPLFGVRTVAQTLMKLLDPLSAEARVVGVFHAPYLPSTAAALAERAGASLCVQALGGLPEASPGKIVRVCRPGVAPETIDLRALVDPTDAETRSQSAAAEPAADARAVAANEAALAGAPGPSLRAAAAAALWLHVARGVAPLAAAESALAALRDGRARAVAARLRSV
jgi:anthranilate phosphoribosyltransferase